MTLVVDASVVVAALIDSGPDGRWAETMVRSPGLVAPHLLPAEVANVIRRAVLRGQLSVDGAALAEDLDAPLATLDRRLSSAAGARCRFITGP